MTYEEFKARTTEKASYETFQKFERMYMAGNIDKDVFCKLMRPLVVAETEAAPFEKEAERSMQSFYESCDKARTAIYDDDNVVMVDALNDAKTFGIAYMEAQRKVNAIYAKI